MIYLELFWTFFKIGLFTIGGGQAMIPMITRDVAAQGWLTSDQIIEFIAIAESTPGPFAINIATYTGLEACRHLGDGAGILGSIMSTFGVILPSLIIIMLVVKLFSSFMKRPQVQQVFVGVRSTVTGLLMAVLAGLFLTILFGISDWRDTSTLQFDFIGMGMFAVIFPLSFIKIKGKKIQPILLVLVCAVVGILCYGFIPHSLG